MYQMGTDILTWQSNKEYPGTGGAFGHSRFGCASHWRSSNLESVWVVISYSATELVTHPNPTHSTKPVPRYNPQGLAVIALASSAPNPSGVLGVCFPDYGVLRITLIYIYYHLDFNIQFATNRYTLLQLCHSSS